MRMPRRSRPITGLLLGLTLLGACADPGSSAARTPVPAVSSPDLVEQSAPPATGPSRGERPRWDAASRAAAVMAARDGLIDYAHTGVSRQDWWRALSPRLSAAARATLSRDGPSTVAITEVRAGGWIVAAPDTDLALTQIPTDVGAYTVLVSRESPRARWLIERITPPHFEGS